MPNPYRKDKKKKDAERKGGKLFGGYSSRSQLEALEDGSGVRKKKKKDKKKKEKRGY